MYQMMLSDLDETLLIGQHVPVFNQEAIREAKKHGLRFVVATGRSHRMIGDILKEIVACFNSFVPTLVNIVACSCSPALYVVSGFTKV